MPYLAGNVISNILKHDAKVTSYKIALLRAINDVVLLFPNVEAEERSIGVPLRTLAEFWVAYYWPFVNPIAPILQGQRAQRNGELTNDISFRAKLAVFRSEWDALAGGASQARPSDGYYVINEFRVPRRRQLYPTELVQSYEQALNAICHTLEMPIRYAGEGEWTVFPKPAPLRLLPNVIPLPGAQASDMCVIVSRELWQTFRDVSLWVEALCIHEWALFTERTKQSEGTEIDRGDAYRLLTTRPDNRRPLTWERNQVDTLLMDGAEFVCPWSERTIRKHNAYALDHLVPIALYPINELWNLVPSDPIYNSRVKRDRLPTLAKLERAAPYITQAYANYGTSEATHRALYDDAIRRFHTVAQNQEPTKFAGILTLSVKDLIAQIADSRNWPCFK